MANIDDKLENILVGEQFPRNNRYLVFAGNDYYPEGGWDDLVFSSNSLDEVLTELVDVFKKYDWLQVIDMSIDKEIFNEEFLQERLKSFLEEIIKNGLKSRLSKADVEEPVT